MAKTRTFNQFGDFQTPPELAARACKVLADRGTKPASVLEPTCGIGNFLIAALDQFPEAKVVLGIDVNETYVAITRDKLAARSLDLRGDVIHQSFFDLDWTQELGLLVEPILVIGNPPWVTNSALGVLGSANLPTKSNFQNRSGLDALTGKSNFDISEWMLIKLIEALAGRQATLAMLCKTGVARKVLAHAWTEEIPLADAEIHSVDAAAAFGATVDACLLVCSLTSASQTRDCRVFRHLGDPEPSANIGYRDDRLIADVSAYERWKHLAGAEIYKWRSGVKHDCASVMELRKEGRAYRNGLDELVDLEDDYLFPMLKSSEIACGGSKSPTRWMLVPQKSVGDEMPLIRVVAPKTWEYLESRGEWLDRRASRIYRNRPRFSIFGIGAYTFAPWKVAISGFYKRLQFATVGPHEGKPVVLDDTSYFLPCQSQHEADYVASLLNSEPARHFFSAYIFWDAKRPITIDVLRRLDLEALAAQLGSESTLAGFRKQDAHDP